jgi:hypothetical protein
MVGALILFALALVLFTGRGTSTTGTGRGGRGGRGQVSRRQMTKMMRRGMGYGPSLGARLLRKLVGALVLVALVVGGMAYAGKHLPHLPARTGGTTQVPAGVPSSAPHTTPKHTPTGAKPTKTKPAPSGTAPSGVHR